MIDGGGVTGYVLHYSMVIALTLSTLLLFLLLKRKGRLDMDESPKYEMLNDE